MRDLQNYEQKTDRSQWPAELNTFVDTVLDLDVTTDLLIRGNIATLSQGWSDIDVTVVVKEVDFDVLHGIAQIYDEQNIVSRYELDFGAIPLDLLIVSEFDLTSNPWHHHGDKPLAYNRQLSDAISVKNMVYNPPQPDNPDPNRLDSFYRLSLLIHNLRRTIIETNQLEQNIDGLCVHSLKRGRLIIKSGLEVFGEYGYNSSLIEQVFSPQVASFAAQIDDIRDGWAEREKQTNDLQRLLKETVDREEQLFTDVIHRLKAESDEGAS